MYIPLPTGERGMEDQIRTHLAALTAEQYEACSVLSIAGALGADKKDVRHCLLAAGIRALCGDTCATAKSEEEEESASEVLTTYSESIGHATFTVREAARVTGVARRDLNVAIYAHDRFAQVDTGKSGVHWQYE